MRFQIGFTNFILRHLEYQFSSTCTSQYVWPKIWINEHIRGKSTGRPTTEKKITQPLIDLDEKDKYLDRNISNTIDSTCRSNLNKTDTVSNDDPGLSTYIHEDNGESLSGCSKEVIPGKGMPPEPPVDCCMSGCANCVWIMYANELKKYYEKDGNERAKREIDKIDNPSLKMFLKLELGLL